MNDKTTNTAQTHFAFTEKMVNELLPLVYNEMRQIAHNKLLFEHQGHTLDTTALVHETYFKLLQQHETKWQSRAHFLAIAAISMKRILINHAQSRNAARRGGTQSRVELNENTGATPGMSHIMARDLLELDDALGRMKQFNERGCQVVEYHFFGGLTWEEISEVMGIAPITVRRAWNTARLWLRRELYQPDRVQPVMLP